MGKKGPKSKQKRLEQEKLAQESALRKERTKTIIAIVVGVVLTAMIVCAIVIPIVLSERPTYDLADKKSYTVSKTATNYVKLNVSYTDNDGKKHNGDIIIKLNPESAPITVANFQKLVGEGFYDGLIFHRVIEGFMIQGGDPLGNGTGGSDQNIKGEFSANGVNNLIKHERGVISMARSGERQDYYGNVIDYGYDTASSQFFIVHQTTASLDGQYAAFGHVVFGMDSVDGIADVKTNNNNKPLREAKIESAVFINYTE